MSEDIVRAIEDRKKLFIKTYSPRSRSEAPHDEWIFNHICTVLDHAAKIFTLTPEEFVSNPGKSYKNELNTDNDTNKP
jgi:hypothetical protein